MYAVAFANDCLIKMADAFEKNNITLAREQLNLASVKLKELYASGSDEVINALMNKISLYLAALKNVEYKKKMEGYK